MISVIVPFHNEKENLPILIDHLHDVLKNMKTEYEILLIDDGSSDGYYSIIEKMVDGKEVILKTMGRQMGKGRALRTGIDISKGEFIVFMDADLQDDPGDLPALYDKVKEGYDLVNGYRHNRQDSFLIKIYSSGAAAFLKTYLRSPFSDINCGFKMFKRKILKDLPLYGNNFRFFPLAAFYEGYRVSEVKVDNKPRIHGKSKYGISKLFIGVIDMISAYFLYRFAERPLHFFGAIGSVFLAMGGVILGILTYQRLFMDMLLYRRPGLQYGILLVILGIQILMTGIIGELMVYLHKKNK
jgi:glycosyltransferase involved in cell wall biosynthesis